MEDSETSKRQSFPGRYSLREIDRIRFHVASPPGECEELDPRAARFWEVIKELFPEDFSESRRAEKIASKWNKMLKEVDGHGEEESPKKRGRTSSSSSSLKRVKFTLIERERIDHHLLHPPPGCKTTDKFTLVYWQRVLESAPEDFEGRAAANLLKWVVRKAKSLELPQEPVPSPEKQDEFEDELMGLQKAVQQVADRKHSLTKDLEARLARVDEAEKNLMRLRQHLSEDEAFSTGLEEFMQRFSRMPADVSQHLVHARQRHEQEIEKLRQQVSEAAAVKREAEEQCEEVRKQVDHLAQALLHVHRLSGPPPLENS